MIVDKILLLQNGWAAQTVCKLRNMQKSARFCDMFLETDTGETVPCHSCIMLANIPSLETDFLAVDERSNRTKLTVRERLKGFSQKTLEQVVLFCYGGFVEVLSSDLDEVLAAAKRLSFDQLIESCEVLASQNGSSQGNLNMKLTKTVSSDESKGTENSYSIVKGHVDLMPKTLESLEDIVKLEHFEEDINVVVSDKVEPSQKTEKMGLSQESAENCDDLKEIESVNSESCDAYDGNIQEKSSEAGVLEKSETNADSGNDSESTDIMDVPEEHIDDPEDVKKLEPKKKLKKSPKKRFKAAKKQFCCDICHRIFVSNSALRDHMNGHNGIKPYRCDKCDKSFAARGSLKEHKAVHKGMTFTCDMCYKVFMSKKQMLRHRKNHPLDYVPKSAAKQEEYKCDICEKVFSHLKSLSDHMNIHKGVKPYKCNLCDKSYAVEASLSDHKVKHRGKQLPCQYCGKFLPSQKKLRKHVKCHGERILEQGNEAPQHKCDECGKQFHSPFNLKQHVKQTHMGISKPSHQFICQVCGKILKTRHGMDLHVVGCTDKGQFQCDFCNKHYVTKSGLEKHITWAHRAEMLSSDKYSKNVKLCNYCGQSFLCKALLIEHEKTHSKERNYKCDICNKTFKSHNNVLTHKRNVHVKNENLFRCDICNTSIKSSGAFKRHKRMHLTRPVHQCDNCGKGYNRKDMLNQHILSCKKLMADKEECQNEDKGIYTKPLEISSSISLQYGDAYPMGPVTTAHKVDQTIGPKDTDLNKVMFMSQPSQLADVNMFQLTPMASEQSIAHIQQHYGLSQVEQSFCRL